MAVPKIGISLYNIMIPAASHSSTSLHRNPVNRIHNGSITACLQIMFCTFFIALQVAVGAQPPVFKDAIAANRIKTYNNIVKNIITKNLLLPLTDSTEENWQDAFYAMEVLQYKQPWVLEKIKEAFSSADKRSAAFQRSLIELVYTNYEKIFTPQANELLLLTKNVKVFAMCAEYLLKYGHSGRDYIEDISGLSWDFEKNKTDSLLVHQTLYPLKFFTVAVGKKPTEELKVSPDILLKKTFLKNQPVVYSIQRKNRNYPGIAIVRDSTGNFIKDSTGNIFSVPQLARSITNLPGYLTNGNTPQGIFRMNGFATSRSAAIGPTENIQLLMPYETSPQYFLKDSSITDTVWTKELYQRLLPTALKSYHPLYGTYYASAIGRTEIIAHGTTVNTDYYRGQTYYPHTPTQGCLCTKEIWSAANGKRTESNQQKLVDAVKKAGGANGYLIVIEIDDKQQPVTLQDVLPFLLKHN